MGLSYVYSIICALHNKCVKNIFLDVCTVRHIRSECLQIHMYTERRSVRVPALYVLCTCVISYTGNTGRSSTGIILAARNDVVDQGWVYVVVMSVIPIRTEVHANEWSVAHLQRVGVGGSRFLLFACI